MRVCTSAHLHAEQAFMERAILLVIVASSTYTSQQLSAVAMHAYGEQVHHPCPARLPISLSIYCCFMCSFPILAPS